MKKLLATIAIAALAGGACASGADSRAAPEAIAADGPAPASDDGAADAPDDPAMTAVSEPTTPADAAASMMEASSMQPVDAEEDAEGRDVVELTAARPPDPAAVARCQAVLAELERRESTGLLEDEADDIELTEDEIDRYQHEPPVVDGGVMASGERPTFPQMPDELDLAVVDAEDLFRSAEHCYEAGVLIDEEFDEDAEFDDAEFCAELAGLSAAEVAEWVAEEGDEIVDEEYAWCELPRPDRQ